MSPHISRDIGSKSSNAKGIADIRHADIKHHADIRHVADIRHDTCTFYCINAFGKYLHANCKKCTRSVQMRE